MSWAQHAIETLRKGQTAQIRPRGHSMTGRVNDRELVTLVPCPSDDLRVGDIVLARVKGRDCLHLIKAINGRRFLIGNNRGGINGWTGKNSIFGKAIRIEP